MTTEETTPYVLSQRQELFDWNEFLNRPRRDATAWMAAGVRARNWVTCACGNQCAIIPRDETGSPLDSELQQLGIRFTGLINHRRSKDALEVLREIELRSAELIHHLTSHSAA